MRLVWCPTFIRVTAHREQSQRISDWFVPGGDGDGEEIWATVDALSWAWENWDRLVDVDNKVGYLYRVGQSTTRRYVTMIRRGGSTQTLRTQNEQHQVPAELDHTVQILVDLDDGRVLVFSQTGVSEVILVCGPVLDGDGAAAAACC